MNEEHCDLNRDLGLLMTDRRRSTCVAAMPVMVPLPERLAQTQYCLSRGRTRILAGQRKRPIAVLTQLADYVTEGRLGLFGNDDRDSGVLDRLHRHCVAVSGVRSYPIHGVPRLRQSGAGVAWRRHRLFGRSLNTRRNAAFKAGIAGSSADRPDRTSFVEHPV